eukprot:g17896.t1
MPNKRDKEVADALGKQCDAIKKDIAKARREFSACDVHDAHNTLCRLYDSVRFLIYDAKEEIDNHEYIRCYDSFSPVSLPRAGSVNQSKWWRPRGPVSEEAQAIAENVREIMRNLEKQSSELLEVRGGVDEIRSEMIKKACEKVSNQIKNDEKYQNHKKSLFDYYNSSSSSSSSSVEKKVENNKENKEEEKKENKSGEMQHDGRDTLQTNIEDLQEAFIEKAKKQIRELKEEVVRAATEAAEDQVKETIDSVESAELATARIAALAAAEEKKKKLVDEATAAGEAAQKPYTDAQKKAADRAADYQKRGDEFAALSNQWQMES